MRDAEKETGVTNQQVSDWRKLLNDIDKYLAKTELAARRKAGWEENENLLAGKKIKGRSVSASDTDGMRGGRFWKVKRDHPVV